ncbi:hypothetical protein Syun_006559 [Stephania yunnanensis]|uniref:Pantoate--beta-alanine ligase n=1 Tax=Stephania yunnanensis TaxID=152371 RepID=A0AAP0KY96_9MAGN
MPARNVNQSHSSSTLRSSSNWNMFISLPLCITRSSGNRYYSTSHHSRVFKTSALIPTDGFSHYGTLALIRRLHPPPPSLILITIYTIPGYFGRTLDPSILPRDRDYSLVGLHRTSAEKLKGILCCSDCFNSGSGGNAVVSCVEDGKSGHETWVRVEGLERGLCGKSRPIFFRGVATVVVKLFNLVEPDVAVLGKKDYQQWRIICRMVRDLDFPVTVIASEIVRESDGLALSSRNVYLSPEERKKALSISSSLSRAKLAAENGQHSCRELKISVVQSIIEAGGKVDYAEIVDQDTLEAVDVVDRSLVFCVAAWFGKVRLIDNMEIDV